MKSPLEQLQLSINAKARVLNIPTYDGLPVGEVPYPFIVFDSTALFDMSPKNTSLVDVLFPLYIWSDYTGSKEAKQLANGIIEEFVDNESTVFMEDFICESVELYELRFNSHRNLGRENKQLTQCVLTLRFLISEK